MSFPLVSVIIPTYNRTDFLELTLESVVNQTYSNIEVIVVDDGTTTDANKELCLEFEKVTYIKIKNSGGPAKPRNIGIRQSKGEYIAFVDDDDIWDPFKIERQLDVLLINPNFGLIHNYCELIDVNGIYISGVIGRPRNVKDKHGSVLLKMIGNWTLMMPTPLVRKTVIEKVGWFNEEIPPGLEDVEYWSRCSFETDFYYLDEPLVKYRKHIGNISDKNDAYIDLPFYLFKVVCEKYNQKKISRSEFMILRLNLCLSQSKKIRENSLKVIRNLFSIDAFWFFKLRIQKTIIKKIIS